MGKWSSITRYPDTHLKDEEIAELFVRVRANVRAPCTMPRARDSVSHAQVLSATLVRLASSRIFDSSIFKPALFI